MEYFKENFTSEIFTLSLGATKDLGGTRQTVIELGGQKTLPFLKCDGEIKNKPIVVAEVVDYMDEDLWPAFYYEYKDWVLNPLLWIREVEKIKPDAICIRLLSCHPDFKNNSKNYVEIFINEVLKATTLPLIILGCGHIEKDNEILPLVCEITKNENLLIGMAVKENYKTIALAAFSCGHSVIAETPLDINLAKQLNILINDLGVPLDKIVMHHTTGGLGYGFEYCYSIMERCRIAGLQGDKFLATPIINMVCEETWKIKEAKQNHEEKINEVIKRAVIWETTTALSYLQGGSDILVLAHPESIKNIKYVIGSFFY